MLKLMTFYRIGKDNKEKYIFCKNMNIMDTVICKEVIVATLTRRGEGVRHSPLRIITQVFEKDGTLIAENDPSPETFALMDMIRFAMWCDTKGISEISKKEVYQWLDEITTRSNA